MIEGDQKVRDLMFESTIGLSVQNKKKIVL